MSEILIIGAGRIGWPGPEQVVWEEYRLIAVTTSGVVLYLDEDGTENVSHGLDVEITDVEWSAFSQLTDMAAEKSTGGCPKCGDDDVAVAAMVPPVCPQCFRGSKRRRTH